VKDSTVDIDLSFTGKDLDTFAKALNGLPKLGYRIDYFNDGDIFGITLPDGYLKKSIPIKKFKRIELRALSPIDIVITKIGRLNDRDKQDINSCIKRFRLSENQIRKRANQLQLAGGEEQYRTNLTLILNAVFHR
jgi:hypothetical protein